MKRQIKRAFPLALDSAKERIVVLPSYSERTELKLTGHQTLPLANNFWIASSSVHSQRGILGSLGQAQIVCSALGVHPLGALLEDTEAPTTESNPALEG